MALTREQIKEAQAAQGTPVTDVTPHSQEIILTAEQEEKLLEFAPKFQKMPGMPKRLYLRPLSHWRDILTIFSRSISGALFGLLLGLALAALVKLAIYR
jgi:hypothetical protein